MPLHSAPVASTPKMTLQTVFWQTGIKFLVDMRADVRKAVKQSPATAGPLRALDRSLRYAAMAHGRHSLHQHHWIANQHDPPPCTFSAFAHHYMLEEHLAQKDATPSSHCSGQSAHRFHAKILWLHLFVYMISRIKEIQHILRKLKIHSLIRNSKKY